MNINMKLKDPSWEATTVGTIRQLAKDFRQEIEECEKAVRFPAALFLNMGEKGLIGTVTPREFGGYGGGVPEYCVVVESVGRYGLVSPQVQVQGQRWLCDWGTPEQKERYLPGMVKGTVLFSESISEPGAASSLKNLNTKAVKSNGDWVITGRKTHINMGKESHVTLVYAMAEEGLTAFLVDTNLPGVGSRHTNPIGGRTLPTAEMSFDNVRVPSSAVLGRPGEGFATFLTTFNVSRLGNASELIGLARRALVEGIRYARERQVGSNVVTDFQGIQWLIADCYSALSGASLMRDHAANLVEEGKEHSLATSMAKKMATEAAEKSVGEIFSLVGGHGLYYDQPFAQLLMEVKVLRVAGGSLEVLRNYVAHKVLKDENFLGLA